LRTRHGLVGGNVAGCAVSTNDGSEVGLTLTLAGGAGLQLASLSATGVLDLLRQEFLHALTSSGAAGQFVYQTSSASDLCQLSKWFDYQQESLSVSIPFIGGVTGSKTDFEGNGVTGTDLGIGVRLFSDAEGLSTSEGQSYTVVLRLFGPAAHAVAGYIDYLDILTWPTRKALGVVNWIANAL
jgi:hypothetical protein